MVVFFIFLALLFRWSQPKCSNSGDKQCTADLCGYKYYAQCTIAHTISIQAHIKVALCAQHKVLFRSHSYWVHIISAQLRRSQFISAVRTFRKRIAKDFIFYRFLKMETINVDKILEFRWMQMLHSWRRNWTKICYFGYWSAHDIILEIQSWNLCQKLKLL